MRSPLAETLSALDASEDYCSYVAGAPVGDGWFRLSAVLDDFDLIGRWYCEIVAGEARSERDVAGSYLASWLTGIVTDTVMGAMEGQRRAWPLDPERLSIHHHDSGWFDGIAVLDDEIRVLPDDPAADRGGVVVVDDLPTLHSEVVGELVAVATPIFAAVRGLAPFGVRGMWGNLADGIASMAVWRARTDGSDPRAAWERATGMVDLLATRARLPARPRLMSTEWSGGTDWFTVKGTCCLYYKTFDGTPDLRGDGYCSSCPLRSDDWRRAHWAKYLDEGGSHGG